ncbi:hypothetical protein ZOSMA_187G00230 [Zostera marina]|uniref:Uncharacterized protein n=1 Tax=Zostera marina TaxID=29655 RepID=A0A0K9PSF2_ZOSMR|nr:hypothetical protein ZOSMA_187G00230 [Zostera marina]
MEDLHVNALKAIGECLTTPPSDMRALCTFLEESHILLFIIAQSPSPDIYDGLKSIMQSIISTDLLEHFDEDIRVDVVACLSEIIRITAPNLPYGDETMMFIFKLIVETFRGLNLISTRSYRKRVLILETMAKVKSCNVILDLDSQLIIRMFSCFFNTIRHQNEENVFSPMEMIMIDAIEASHDISDELIRCLLSSVKKDGRREVNPIAYVLGKRVIEKTHTKLRPYLIAFFESSGRFQFNYSKIVTKICQNTKLPPWLTIVKEFGSKLSIADDPEEEDGVDAAASHEPPTGIFSRDESEHGLELNQNETMVHPIESRMRFRPSVFDNLEKMKGVTVAGVNINIKPSE